MRTIPWVQQTRYCLLIDCEGDSTTFHTISYSRSGYWTPWTCDKSHNSLFTQCSGLIVNFDIKCVFGLDCASDIPEKVLLPWIHHVHRFAQLAAAWWRHQMKTFSALLAICAENSPVHGEFPAQRPVTRNFDVYFDLRPNKRLSKQSWSWWFETLSCSLWRHRNGFRL